MMKGKKASIVIRLIDESIEKPNGEIEKEIFNELSESMGVIPWLKKIEKITVRDD